MYVHIRMLYITRQQILIHEVLPKSPQNLNAAKKMLVVQFCAARYCELYPLWISMPSGIVLYGHVCFICAFFDVMLVMFCNCTDLLKCLMWRSNGFASNSASNLARQQRKDKGYLKKHLVLMS